MAHQMPVEGQVQAWRSKATESTVIHTVVMAVSQKEMVSVGCGMRVWRIICVPKAQVAAATSIITTPPGFPLRFVSSYQSSSSTASAAAATPIQARPASRWPNHHAPTSAENTGIV